MLEYARRVIVVAESEMCCTGVTSSRVTLVPSASAP